MKKRILCFVLTMAMVLSMLVVIPAATVSAEDEELYISTAAEFKQFRDDVNSGVYDTGIVAYLEADIDISGENWTPIGNSGSHPFVGTFDGQGHTISGIVQDIGSTYQGASNTGLFGNVSSLDDEETTICNFKLTSSGAGLSGKGVNGNGDIGTVISQVRGSTTGVVTVNVTGVWSTAKVDSSSLKMVGVGGIVGNIGWVSNAQETILNVDSCRYSGTIDSPSAGSNDYGGIVGWTRENNSVKTFNITNCLYDGVMILNGSAPDDNGGIIGYLKGNATSAKLTCHIENCIVAGQFQHPNKSGYAVTGYVLSEVSGSNTDYQVRNVYYCNDSDRHTGGDLGGWYGYYKQGAGSISSLITYSNVTAKTMTQLKAMTSGSNFADDSKWHFGESDELPVPAMIYDNIIANEEVIPSIFDDLTQDEFTITTADELMEFASIVNAGTSQFEGKTVYLGADIDLTGYSWVSIGKTRGGGATTFRGTFDGQGHTISNMTSTVGNADGEGGLFGYVVYSATIQNFKLTGTITMTATGNSGNGYGYIGSVIGCAFQTTATINLSNIWSSVNITCSNNSSKGISIGGLIGQLRAGDNMGTLTLNIDSCVYDGSISDGNRYDCVGGFIGRTHENRSGRPLYLTISNSVFAGSIHVNDIYSEDISCLIGYIKGNTSSGAVNVTIENVISTGRVFFYTGDSREWNPVTKCVGGILSSEITGSVPVITVNNLYYKNFQVPVGAANAATWQDTVLYFNETSCTINVEADAGKMTSAELLALDVTEDLSASKWTKLADTAEGKYYPLPTSIYDYFGAPEWLFVENTDVYVATASALNALATAVNGGKTYEGKIIHISDDITIESGWTSIGITSSRPFMGSFNGHGHTIEINQTASNPDGTVGFIAFSRTPAGGTVTIENLHLTGRINVTNSNASCGYFGGVAGCVDGNTSGSGGTINFKNVWNSLYISCGNNNMWTGVGGFIGFTRHADGLKPLTVNFDSCVWDGTLNVGPAAYHFGGYVGYTGNNKAGRTLTINIENSVAAGKIALNQTWDQYAGLLIGYARGGYSDAETAMVTVNVNNVLSNGTMTFKSGVNCPGTDSKIGHIGRIDDTTNNVINLTNLYYNAFDRGYMGTPAPALGNLSAKDETNVVATSTKVEQYALTENDFSDSTKWYKTTSSIVCPQGIYSTFGVIPEVLVVSVYEVSDEIFIGTAAEFIEFRDLVNGGMSMAGKTITLSADLDLDILGLNGENEWVEVGRGAAKAFKGTFDGNGHTINYVSKQKWTSGYIDTQAGLFGHLNGAIVRNLILTGEINLHNNAPQSAGETDYIGSVAGAVTGTTIIQNVHSSVDITTRTSKNTETDTWPKGVGYVGGLVGFIPHNTTADITISGCVYAGTINAGNQAKGYSGIMAFTGTGGTKTVTITNTAFTGRMTLNENYAYAFEGVAGIFGVVSSGTVTITGGTHSGGRIYFNTTKAWPAADGDNPVKTGQIVGYVNQSNGVDTGTLVIDESVNYVPAKYYTAVPHTEEALYVLPEVGRINGVYGGNGGDNSPAFIGGMEASCEARNVNDAYKGIRFKATFYTTSSCTGGGTKSANFGLYLLTKETYMALGGGDITKAALDGAGSTVIQVQATKYTNNTTNYVVNAVLFNLNTETRKSTEIVAIPYAGSSLGTATMTTYNEAFN